MAQEVCDTDHKDNCFWDNVGEELYLGELEQEKVEIRSILSFKVGGNTVKYEQRLEHLFQLASDAFMEKWSSINRNDKLIKSKKEKYEKYKKVLMDEIGIVDRNEYEEILSVKGNEFCDKYNWEACYGVLCVD